MQIGLIGLGKMGGAMAERWRRHDHQVVGFDIFKPETDVKSLAELVAALTPAPRIVWAMVPAGEPTEAVITELADRLAPGDIVIDGGNSFYGDSQRRAAMLAEKGIGFVDCGTSGGVWGLAEGYCLMAGGDAATIAHLRPLFDALAQKDGFAHVGPAGTGHFTKMVHNGIEYGLMQAYAEGYELLTASDMGLDVPAAMAVWRHGSVVRSWLLDLLVKAVGEDPGLSRLTGYASDSGEGRWAVEAGIRLAVPLPVISSALFARFASRQVESPAMKVVSALRQQFGGHAVHPAVVAGDAVPSGPAIGPVSAAAEGLAQ
ncbi:MAG: decarboxylating 6-phosphogluconate dehydrogenase [Candidatus Sericytochromatia bacterium]|nr:decarboxylating 6-phosphogluconate dehydrogenase [Candidatus Sericytochromatia bacterium]